MEKICQLNPGWENEFTDLGAKQNARRKNIVNSKSISFEGQHKSDFTSEKKGPDLSIYTSVCGIFVSLGSLKSFYQSLVCLTINRNFHCFFFFSNFQGPPWKPHPCLLIVSCVYVIPSTVINN